MPLLAGLAVLLIGSIAAWNGFAMPHELAWPLDRAHERPQLLTYGLYVTPDPAQNPIDPPERFTGYHTALDFEILPGEENADVPVYALCPGAVLYADTAEGYGGVIVHRCIIGGQDVTVLYGHVDRSSFAVHVGDSVERGQRIASLAPAKSADSGETRKHLHVGIRKGRTLELWGYVQSEAELSAWIDPRTVLP